VKNFTSAHRHPRLFDGGLSPAFKSGNLRGCILRREKALLIVRTREKSSDDFKLGKRRVWLANFSRLSRHPENGDARKKVRPGRARPGQPQPDKNKVMMEITMDKPRHGRRDSLSNSAAR
jgi:hypothetical protein